MKKYQDAIVELRAALSISQEELAKLLGVSFSSVNRWENGRTIPTKIAQVKLNKLFKEYSIKMEE